VVPLVPINTSFLSLPLLLLLPLPSTVLNSLVSTCAAPSTNCTTPGSPAILLLFTLPRTPSLLGTGVVLALPPLLLLLLLLLLLVASLTAGLLHVLSLLLLLLLPFASASCAQAQIRLGSSSAAMDAAAGANCCTAAEKASGWQ
jgi:hypothetical protein